MPVEKTPETSNNKTSNPFKNTMTRAELVGDNEALNSIFEKYNTTEINGKRDDVLDTDEIGLVLDELAPIIYGAKNELQTLKKLDKENPGLNMTALYMFVEKFSELYSQKVFMNKKIGPSFQGRQGDCWGLTAGNSTENTRNGSKYIEENMFSGDDKGNIIVKFDKVKEPIIFSSNTFKWRRDLSKGSYTVQALERALELHREDVLSANLNNPNRHKSALTYTGDYKGDMTEPLDGGLGEVAIYIMTGKKSDVYHSYNTQYVDYPDDVINKRLTKSDVEDYLEKIKEDSQRYAVCCSFYNDYTDSPEKLIPGHDYTLKSVNGDEVTLINPHNSTYEIKRSKSDFLNLIIRFAAADMGE